MATQHSRRSIISIAALALAAALALSACTARTNVVGYVPDDDEIAQIVPGKQSKQDVEKLLGSPSSLASFKEHNNTWYYISSRTETFAFLSPETTKRTVLAIDFDDNGIVKNVRHYKLEDGRDIEMVERVTPTRGKELNFFEQMFGNFGRFTKPK
jgi:outer membrane protein assembly factor BamE (lipoprotein component of BamABCDE complex)